MSYWGSKKKENVMAYNGEKEAWNPPTEGFYMTDALRQGHQAFISDHENKRSGSTLFLISRPTTPPPTSPHCQLHAFARGDIG